MKIGDAFPLSGAAAVHVYRIVQEALNNVTRHSGSKQAWVRLRFFPESLTVEIEDRGIGFAAANVRQGIGLVAMRERAELVNGKIEFLHPASGTLVRLCVPREALETNA
jgi:signal transduction histidine kinase